MFYKARNEVPNFFDDYSLMVSDAKLKATKGTTLKILTPKKMLQWLPVALANVKAGNNSHSLLSEIRQIVYSLYQSKEITKKVYSNIIKSIQLWKWILYLWTLEIVRFLNNYVLILKITDKLDLRRGEKNVALSNLSIYYTWKNIKSLYNNNKFKISPPIWNDQFELPDGSYPVTDIQDYCFGETDML